MSQTAKEKVARLLSGALEITASDAPPVPAGLAARTAAMAADLPVVRRILSPSYTVRPSLEANAIRCTSHTGIADDTDAAFDAVMTAFRRHFGERLLEVSHNVCAFHQDFTIYLANR